MFRLSALNEQTNESTAGSRDLPKGTKEAQEAYAFSLYNNALQLQSGQRHDEAIEVYEDLLETSLVTNAATTLVDENGEATERPLKDPGLILKYSTHKNMASMAADSGDINTAMEHYLQAVMLDPSDVTLWQRIGTLAISLGRLALARHAFTCGLQCNENYWPCLDSAITVLYALSDYETCMYWIAKALEKDFGYTKGLVFREKMICECPHLRSDCQPLFNDCSLLMHDVEIDEEEAKQFINEALELREQHRIICKPQAPRPCPVSPPLKKLSWLSLSESLLSVYELIINSTEYTFTSPILFGNLTALEQQHNKKDEFEIVDVEESEDCQQASKLNETIDIIKDDYSLIEQSTEESVGFSEESRTDFPASAHEDTVTSHWSVTQQLGTAQLFDDEIVRDVVEDLLGTICACTVEEADVVAEARAASLVTMTTEVVDSDVVMVEKVLQNLIEKIVKSEESVESRTSSHNDDVTGVEANNDESDQDKLKKVTKKKKVYLDSSIEEHMMRRSNRVKTSIKKRTQKEKVIPEVKTALTNYKQELSDLFPQQLWIDVSSEDATEKSRTDNCNISPVWPTLAHAYSTECDDVSEFVQANEGEFIVDIMLNFCHALAEKLHVTWEKGVREIVAKIFIKTRSHIIQPYLSEVDDFKPVKKLLFDNLACIECVVDGIAKKNSSQGLSFPGIFEQFDFLMMASTSYVNIFKVKNSDSANFEEKSRTKTWKPFTLRTLWSRSKYYIHLSQYVDAVNDLEFCKDILNTVLTDPITDEKSPGESPENYVITLPNIEQHPVISVTTVAARLKSLEQTQIFQSADKLFEDGLYDEVVNVLKPVISRNSGSKAFSGSHRAKPIRQLFLSFQHLSDYASVLSIAGNAIQEVVEAIKQCEMNKKATSSSKRRSDSLKQWNSAMHTVLQVSEKAVKSYSALKEASIHDRTSLSQSISNVIDHVLSRVDHMNLMKNVLISWNILYRLFASVECDQDVVNSENPPASFLLLSTAHEWLGEKNLCCFSDGSLLKFFISEVSHRFSGLDITFKEECDYYVEQCFYCLHSYPNRPKTRRIADHNAKQVSLTWKDGVFLFQHFRPTYLPEFDSFKTSTVSLELSQLLLKLLPLVPTDILKEIKISESDLLEWIDNSSGDVAMLTQSSENTDLSLLSDMYYLLADYYFKNNEMTKAVKYYLLDLRIKPERFDAWAGLALSKSSQIDDRLRLCENKKSQHKVKDSGTERRGLAALACFKQALKMDSHNMKLLIEYGSLAYWLHSMLSRKIKRSESFLEDDEKKKVEMLCLSRCSFEKVQECESDEIHDEEWLIQYMLGKISEKQGKPLKEFLKYYQNAAYILHRRNAKYPKKIQAKYVYANDYAVEALEMHFRIHASIFKYALKNPYMTMSEQLFIKDVLEELKRSPFVTRHEIKSAQAMGQDAEKASKLVVTSQSSDLTMGSLLPENVLRSLNIEEAKPDEDSQSSACSLTQPSGEQSMDEAYTEEQQTQTTNKSRLLSNQDTETSKSDEPTFYSIITQQSEKSNELLSQVDIDAIIESCESAFRLCMRRFPHHIKAIYRLAHIYATCPSKQNISWSCDLLYGTSSPWQQLRHMPAPGLLADRNKTNLFNGVWRIPMDDIDRPGSFPAHLYRCLALLFDVLRRSNHHQALLHIHNLLHRTPEPGKKYLREEDRILLAGRALVYCRGIITRKINCLGSEKADASSSLRRWSSTTSKSLSADSSAHESFERQEKQLGNMVDTNEESLSLLMDAYRVYQDTQKHNEVTTRVDLNTEPDDKTHQGLLLEAYHKYTCLTRKDDSPTDKSTQLEEALRFCHQQNTLRKSSITTTKPAAQSLTSSANHQANNVKPVAAVAPQKRQSDSSAVDLNADKKEQSENGAKLTEASPAKPPYGQITMVEDKGRTYTRIAPPPSDLLQRSFAPAGAIDAPPERNTLRKDPNLRHLQITDPTKKQLLRSTSVPVSYPAGEENTPPHRRLLCRTGSCVSDSTKLKLKNSILARTSAALVRKPSITDQEMFQLRTGTGPDDSDSSDSDDDEVEEERGRKRKFSDDATTPPSTTNEHPSLISAHQSAVITTAAST